MTIQELCAAKNRLGYTYEQISEKSGVPLATVQKVLGGFTANPRHDTICALESVLCPAQYDLRLPDPLIARESGYVFGSSAEKDPGKCQGEYTVTDYLSLPDEERCELIDGVLYNMSSPTREHQQLSFSLGFQFQSFINSRGGACEVYLAPLDVRLDKDDRTMVQPDVMVVCDGRDRFEDGKRLLGAPDLAAEITSPSTLYKDSTVKLHKYKVSGVREYWLIDPEQKRVTVYSFEKESVQTYSFNDRIPVGIWDGGCEVSLS